MTAIIMAADTNRQKSDHFLDITSEVCPMTFVKTRLMIERMAVGETALIRLVGEEPLGNVPASVTELGHDVLSTVPEQADATGPSAVHLLHIRKN